MSSWYLFSLAALLLMGSQRFLYKVAAERNCNSTLTTTVFMATVALLSGGVFLFSGEPAGDPVSLIVLSLVNSIAFAMATLAHMEALRHLPAGITFPLTRMSLLVVIVFSVVRLGERPDPLQWIGMLLGLSVIAVLAGEAGSGTRPQGKLRTGLLAIAVCVVGGAAAAISSKLAAVSTSKAGFMALSYLLATLFSLLIARFRSDGRPAGPSGEAVGIGILMGLLNFFGFYAFLTALETGPLSLIVLITGMHFVIAIALSVLLYRERMTPRRTLGLALTLLAVLFLQL